MNEREFSTWWTDYATKFPSTSRWINDLGSKLGKAQLDLWREILAETPLRAALKVNQAMAHGDLEVVGHWDADRERTAVVIKRQVRARLVAGERREASQKLLRREDANQCVDCRDTGYVDVWHHVCISAVRNGEPYHGRTMVVPCDCPLGLAKCWTSDEPPPRGWRGPIGESSVFHPDRFCKPENLDVHSPAAIERFETWCEAYFESVTPPGG